jgi:DnaJ-class molecular chaperone
MARLHHPDHNGGSLESARRFEAVQEAYTQILTLRRTHAAAGAGAAREARQSQAPPSHADAGVEARLADLERELRKAQAARDQARRAARDAARAQAPGPERERPSDEELGYVETDDSFSKILADAASEVSGRISQARSEVSDRVSEARHEHPVPKSFSELIDELAAKLTGEPPER